jgi:GxxExxY protein
MHPDYQRADSLSGDIIAAAIEVHKNKGPGLIESIYEKCFMHELTLRNITAVNQMRVPIEYKGYVFEEKLRLDVLVEQCLLVEIKVVKKVLPIHKAQLLSYMKLLNVPVGLLFNFNEILLKDGMSRLVLKDADRQD